MLEKLAQYKKTIASVIGTALVWATASYVPDGHVDRAEWIALAMAVATSIGVFQVRNDPPAPPEA